MITTWANEGIPEVPVKNAQRKVAACYQRFRTVTKIKLKIRDKARRVKQGYGQAKKAATNTRKERNHDFL